MVSYRSLNDKTGGQNVSSFYNGIADSYDSMTAFGERLKRETPVFEKILRRYSIKTAVDAGAGTGLHSVILAKLGVDVTSVDISKQMLERLEINAQEQNVRIKTVCSDFFKINEFINGTYDAVLSLGNTISHLLSDQELLAAFNNFNKLLNDNSILILQTVNYDNVMREKNKIQSIREQDGKTFIRYYEYHEGYIDFNVVIYKMTDTGPDYSINTTRLNPVCHDQLIDLLRQADFSQIDFFGNLSLEHYDKNNSANLVVVAHKRN